MLHLLIHIKYYYTLFVNSTFTVLSYVKKSKEIEDIFPFYCFPFILHESVIFSKKGGVDNDSS